MIFLIKPKRQVKTCCAQCGKDLGWKDVTIDKHRRDFCSNACLTKYAVGSREVGQDRMMFGRIGGRRLLAKRRRYSSGV